MRAVFLLILFMAEQGFFIQGQQQKYQQNDNVYTHPSTLGGNEKRGRQSGGSRFPKNTLRAGGHELTPKQLETLQPDLIQKQLETLQFHFNGSIHGFCLTSILNQICEVYRTSEPSTRQQFSSKDTGISCYDKGCKITELQRRFCPLPEKYVFSNSSETQTYSSDPRSRSGNNNFDPGCARYVKKETYANVSREAGWNCEQNLRCVCGNCQPTPRTKDEVLKIMFQKSFNELVSREIFNSTTSVKAQNVETNYALRSHRRGRRQIFNSTTSVKAQKVDTNYPIRSHRRGRRP